MVDVAKKGYGWKPALPDVRNYKLNFFGAEVAPEVDLRKGGLLPDVWDQGQLGSCTAHGAGAAYSFSLAKQGWDKNFLPSRLFVYYNSRQIEGTVSEDSGATITDAIKSLNRYGAPIEADWTYDVGKFSTTPPQKAYDDGKLREAVKYAEVPGTIQAMQACLTAGTPIVIGFTVYDSFESDAVARTGNVPLPSTSEQILGGHCVLVVGYTTFNGSPVWIARNSWGTDWGIGGYFYFPQSYLTNPNLASDFWTVQTVSSPDPAPVPPTPAPIPTPTPAPTPSPVDADAALWNVVGPWTKKRHCCAAKTTSDALRLWSKAKNFK